MNGESKFNGLSDAQVLMLMSQIATTINLVCEVCREAAERHGCTEAGYTFHALDTLLCGVGAMADHATGGGCIGGFTDWMMGPLFNRHQETGGEA